MTAESSRFPLWLPVFIGSGVAFYFSQSAPTPLWPYVFVAILAALLSIKLWSRVFLRLFILAVLAIMLGAIAANIRLQAVEAPILREQLFFKTVEGTIEDLKHKEGKIRIILSAVNIENLPPEDTPKRVSITVKKNFSAKDLQIGARIAVNAMLFPPPVPVMPRAYDFSRMFYFEQIGATGFSAKPPEIIRNNNGEHGFYDYLGNYSAITKLRLAISDHLVAKIGEEAGSVASALMVGEQSRVSDEISESMRTSGIYHILSISGLHMALASGMVFFVIRLILALIPYTALNWPTKKIAACGALLAGAAYLLLAGSPVPAVRSYIMVACVLTAILCDRKGISMYSLGWAATLILLFIPESLLTASFQLSFAATLAIVALYERFGHMLYAVEAGFIRRAVLYMIALMATSLAASLYTTPLAIYHFNRMAIYGVFANMLIVPLSSIVIMPSALLVFILMPFSLDDFPLMMLRLGIEAMLSLSAFVADFPYANITLPAPSYAGFMLMVIGGLWLALWTTKLRWLGIFMVLCGLATILLFKPYDLIISDDGKRVAYRGENGKWSMLRGNPYSFEADIWLRSQGEEVMLARKEALLTFAELVCDKNSCTIDRNSHMTVISLAGGSSAGKNKAAKNNPEKDKPEKNQPEKNKEEQKPEDDLCESGADIIISERYLSCADEDIYNYEHSSNDEDNKEHKDEDNSKNNSINNDANYNENDNSTYIIDRYFLKKNKAVALRFNDSSADNDMLESNSVVEINTVNDSRGNWPWIIRE